MPRKKELSFEESLEKLEGIVKEMEGGDLTLKDLMSHYSEGVGLAKNCMSALERAEQLLRAFADAVPTLPWGKRP